MDGVTWFERQPTDWLASNGRWYPVSKYPGRWYTSALPPAPGHGGANSILQKYAEKGAELTAKSRPQTQSPTPQAPPAKPESTSPSKSRTSGGNVPNAPAPPTASAAPGFSVTRPGRQVADATVTEQRTYANAVGAAAPPPPAIPAAVSTAPGRVRSDAPMSPQIPAPTRTPTVAVTPAAPVDKSDFEVVAGDLGSVLSSAKKRIEKALNDNFEG